MTNEATIPRHRLQKAIELSRDADDRFCLYCERCDTVTRYGQSWCCTWAHLMFDCYMRLKEAA